MLAYSLSLFFILYLRITIKLGCCCCFFFAQTLSITILSKKNTEINKSNGLIERDRGIERRRRRRRRKQNKIVISFVVVVFLLFIYSI